LDTEVGIVLPFEVKGRLSAERKAEFDRLLGTKQIQANVAKAIKYARKSA
jgi:hypothetical protein